MTTRAQDYAQALYLLRDRADAVSSVPAIVETLAQRGDHKLLPEILTHLERLEQTNTRLAAQRAQSDPEPLLELYHRLVTLSV